ncbi:flagellar hook assembly protein FlgD [bacterium]|nr:flagellar hook assembly protein FlgD [bacterium]
MSDISGITNYQVIGNENAIQSSALEDKNDFLTLLVAQMQYQDPLNPLDGADFAAQLAQFSSLEELQNINTNLSESINADMLLALSINNTMATTIVGKSIRAASNEICFKDGKPVDIDYELSGNAARVKIDIYNEDGQLLRTITETGKGSGDNAASWDGRDAKGNLVPQGSYYVDVSATAPGGGTVAAQALAVGVVTGVRFVDGNPMLIVNGREIAFGSVLEINASTEDNSDPQETLFERIMRQSN